MQSENVESFVMPKSALRKRSRCYWENRSKGNMRRLELSKTKKYMKKNSPFVADFGCNW